MRDLGEQNLTLLDQGRKAATTMALEASKPEGQPGEVTASVGTEIERPRWSLSVAAWFKRKFTHGGTSAGVKGEMKF